MADLAHKRSVRGGHRGSTTKMLRTAEEILAQDRPDQAQVAKTRLSLQEKVTVLKSLDAEIVDLVNEDDIADEIERTDAYMGEVYATIARLDQLSRIDVATAGMPAPRPPAPVSSHDKVKLPKLSIQPFSGDLTSWTTFWDAYQAAIDGSRTLSDIDKFTYLRSLLQGPALHAIAGLTLTAANYREAIDVLKERFGNRQKIIDKHMETLLNMEAVTSNTNSKALRQLYDTVEAQVRGLKALGVDSGSYGSLLSSVLMSRIPQEIRLIISRAVGGGEWQLDELLRMFHDELQARERAATSDTKNREKPREPPLKLPPTGSSLLAGGNPTCYYCQRSHLSHACTTVTSVEQRRRILRESGRCFVCLRRGHIVRQCTSKGRCPHCKGRHHGSICNQKAASDPPTTGETRPRDSGGSGGPTTTPTTTTNLVVGLNPAAEPFQPPTTTSLWADCSHSVLLPTARAHVYNPDDAQRSKTVRIILDSGSQRSYITDQLKSELALRPNGEQSMTILTFGSCDEVARVCEVVNVCVIVRGGSTKELTLYTVPTICEPLTCQPITLCQANFGHLVGLPLSDSSDGKDHLDVDILIGCDLYWSFLTGQTRRGDNGPVAIDTVVGWVLSGPVGIHVQQHVETTLLTHTLRIDGLLKPDARALDECLQSFWRLESLGITEPERSVHDEFRDKIRFEGGRYEVSLPWKNPDQTLADNYQLSLRRLQGLIRRLRQDADIFHEYDAIIKSQLKQGIVELVENPDTDTGQRIHYLPHHAVVRCNKETTKLRVVYDASARSSSPSLNDCLHSGPKFDQRILDLLVRFRAHRVALVADIEKAFLMVSMTPNDRDVLRFLWVDDIKKDPPDIQVLRFTRVVFGVTASPFLLNATIRHHLESYLPSSTIEKLLKSFYVDDLVAGADDENEAYLLFQDAKNILQQGGFNLRKFRSNSSMLQLKMDEQENPPNPDVTTQSDESYASTTLGTSNVKHCGETKVLGVRWDVSNDLFVMSLREIASTAAELEPTKRSIVSLVGRFYDPMGLLSPIVIRLKIFLQELCEARLEWDEPLAGELLATWQNMSTSLREGPQTFSVPRCLVKEQVITTYELCGFCDASKKAFAAVVYLRAEAPEGQQVRIVGSKTRVAPLKQQTIPRLELLSALLLARLMASISQALQGDMEISGFHCFTDSTVALHWIIGVDKSWKPFVHNRVTEIRSLLPPRCWNHCPGQENPADLPSRGLTPQEFASSSLWLKGPDWLKQNVEESLTQSQMPMECLAEEKRSVTQGLLVNSTGPNEILRCEDFSSVKRLFSVTALILKFCHILLRKIRSDPDDVTDFASAAETLWIVSSQRTLVSDKNFPQLQRQFGLFQDEHKIWRCGGRIQNAGLPAATVHPILLSKDHPLTALYIQQAHGRVMHGGVKSTLTELRSRFWVVKGRSIVRQILRRCVVCRRYEGQPYSAPPPPPLPSFRVEEAPPFAHTGIDFAGPLYTKPSSDASSNKVWICLYTCCVTRAVHLDLIPDLSTEAFLRSFKRFAARRGVPVKVVSDNGKTFKAAAKLLKSIVSHDDVQHYMSGLGVKWIFNLPKAPWWGGVFERLIRSTKRCLRKVIGRASLTYDELLTALVEVEAVINSRPLTYVASDDLDEPLTPSHLLTGRRILSLPDHLCRLADDDDEVESGPSLLTRRARHVNKTIDAFWKRWAKEYLLELREAHRYHRGRTDSSPIAVNDVVVVHSKDQPRGFWKLGRVKSVLTGRDGAVRGATVKVAGRGRQATSLSRPIQLLYPLEVPTPDTTPPPATNPAQTEPGDAADASATVMPPRVRRTRRAAQEARDRMLALAWDESEN